MESILGEGGAAHFSLPPGAMVQQGLPRPRTLQKSHSEALFNREQVERALVAEGVHRNIEPNKKGRRVEELPLATEVGQLRQKVKAANDPSSIPEDPETDFEESFSQMSTMTGGPLGDLPTLSPSRSSSPLGLTTDEVGHRGQAHDPLEDHLYLYIGPSTFAGTSGDAGRDGNFTSSDEEVPVVSESPGAADVDIYETAYRDEIERIRARANEAGEPEKEPTVYLTRRVDVKLMALSGAAGRWMAVGEEARNQIRDYTQFQQRKAKVTEVSRALRQAAKDEYDRKKQERKTTLPSAKAEKTKVQEETAPELGRPPASLPAEVTATETTEPPGPSRSQSSVWKSKANDKGRQARTSLMGFVGMVKSKGKAKSKDEDS